MRGLIINHNSGFSSELSKLFRNCDIVNHTHFNIDHANQYDYIVLSGGEIHISFPEDIELEKYFLRTCNKPIFAVCLGMQIISLLSGELLLEMDSGRKTGKEELKFRGLMGKMVYNHGWFIPNIPKGYKGILGTDGVLKAIYNDKLRIMGFQGHPELAGEFGIKLRDMFLNKYLT